MESANEQEQKNAASKELELFSQRNDFDNLKMTLLC